MLFVFALAGCLFSGAPLDEKLDALEPATPADTPPCADGLPQQEGLRDADRDGYGAGTPELLCTDQRATTDIADCDDQDPDTFPGAEEQCDGIDRDCQGDGDAAAFVELYEDLDGDGFGTAAVNACPAAGLAAMSGDCDDADAAVNPAAPELCNGIDDDCANGADDGLDVPQWFADDDGDGFGASDDLIESCEAPSGFVADDTDCNDDDPDVGGATLYFVDGDDDGFGDANDAGVLQCEANGLVANSDDCDDSDANINPAANDIGGGPDMDCDGDLAECDQTALVHAGDTPQAVIDLMSDACGSFELELPARETPYAGFSMSENGQLTCTGPSDSLSCRFDGPVVVDSGGVFDGLDFESASGGCLHVTGGTLLLRNARFDGCTGDDGGSIAITDATVDLDSVDIADSTGSSGGAIHVGAGAELTGQNLTLTGTSSSLGALSIDTGGEADLNQVTYTAGQNGTGGAFDVNGELTLENATVTTGSADFSPALTANFATVTLEGVVFTEGFAAIGGNTMMLLNSSTVTGNQVTMENFWVDFELIQAQQSAVTLTSSVFSSNQVDNGPLLRSLMGTTVFTDVEFSNNIGTNGIDASLVYLEQPSVGSAFTDVRILDNAGQGPLVTIFQGPSLALDLTRLTAARNSAQSILKSDGSLRLQNALFYDNVFTTGFSLIDVAIPLPNRRLEVLNSTFADNFAPALIEFSADSSSVFIIRDSIFAYNQFSGISSSFGMQDVVSHSTFFDTAPPGFMTEIEVSVEDPLLDASSSPPYQLLPGSPALGTASDGGERGVYGGPEAP